MTGSSDRIKQAAAPQSPDSGGTQQSSARGRVTSSGGGNGVGSRTGGSKASSVGDTSNSNSYSGAGGNVSAQSNVTVGDLSPAHTMSASRDVMVSAVSGLSGAASVNSGADVFLFVDPESGACLPCSLPSSARAVANSNSKSKETADGVAAAAIEKEEKVQITYTLSGKEKMHKPWNKMAKAKQGKLEDAHNRTIDSLANWMGDYVPAQGGRGTGNGEQTATAEKLLVADVDLDFTLSLSDVAAAANASAGEGVSSCASDLNTSHLS